MHTRLISAAHLRQTKPG